jgi:hypothetical protein
MTIKDGIVDITMPEFSKLVRALSLSLAARWSVVLLRLLYQGISLK